MQAFSVYFKILKKQFVPLLIYASIFVGLTMLISSSIKSDTQDHFVERKVSIMIVNEEGENLFLNEFIQYLQKYVTIVDAEESEELRRDALFFRRVSYILTIPKGFTESLFQGKDVSLLKQIVPDSASSISVDQAIDNYMNTAKTYIKYKDGITYEDLNTYLVNNFQNEIQVDVLTKQVDEKQNAKVFNMFYFNNLGYIILACLIIGVSSILLSFHSIEIRRKHYASPVSDRKINLQLMSANFVFVICYLFLFLLLGYLLNPYGRLDKATMLYWLNAFVFSLTALSISYLIGITVRSKNAVSAISTMVSLSLAFISGIFVPQEFLGKSVLKVASFTPTYWFVKGNQMIASIQEYQWDSVANLFGYMAIQLGFTAAIISIIMVVSKQKRQKAY